MIIKLPASKDTYIRDDDSDIQTYNYGQDSFLAIYKDSDENKARTLIQFDLSNLEYFRTHHGLSYSDISSSILNLYDISNATLLDHNFVSENKFANCNVEILFLAQNWDEGTGSENNPVTGYSDWINASENTVWSTSGGSTSSITALTTLTSSFLNSTDSLSANVTNYLQYISLTSGTANHYGFLVKLTNTYESSTGTNYYKKEFISNQFSLSSYRPEILVYINKRYKDESTSIEYGRDNTFGLINYNTNYVLESMTACTTAILKAYNSSTSTTATTISSSGGLSFTTYYKGNHYFNYNIPYSLSAYVNPYLELIYSTTSGSKSITAELSQDRLLSLTNWAKILRNEASLYWVINPNNDKIDITSEFTQFNIKGVYTDFNYKITYINFDAGGDKIFKMLEYKLYDEYDKTLIDWTYSDYNSTNNFVLIHNSLLNTNSKYFIDLRVNSLYFKKAIEFTT